MTKDDFIGWMVTFGIMVVGGCLLAASMYGLGFVAMGVAAADAFLKSK